MSTVQHLSLHSDLEAVLTDFDSNLEAVHSVTDGLSYPELTSQPTPGASWSILQCVEHLVLANGFYTAGMAAVLEDKRSKNRLRAGPISPSAAGAVFLKKLEPPVNSKVRAPNKIIPRADKSKSEVLDAFTQSHRRIRETILSASDLDLNAIRFRNPLLPLLRVRVGTGLLIMAAHERRHLWQAWQVRAEFAK